MVDPPQPDLDDREQGDETPPDVVAMPASRATARRGRWWPSAVVVVLGAAAVWYFYPKIVQIVSGHSSAAAKGTAGEAGGKASLGFNSSQGDAAKPGAAARIQTVRLEVVPRYDVLKVTGSLMADERSSVAANTSGIAAEVCVDRGSTVKKGDVLVRIDPRDAKHKYEEGLAVLDELKARLGITGDVKDFKPEEEPEVLIAKASERLAAANYRRAKDNIAKKVISTEAFDQAKTEYDLAAQRCRQTEFQIMQALYVCKTAQIKVEILRKALVDTEILAPFDGWVAEKLVAPGEQISSGMQATTVVTLVRIDPLRLSLTVPQKEIGRIRVGQAVWFRVDSFPGQRFSARVRFVAPVVNNDTRSMVVEAVAKNSDPDHPLRPGLFATADIEVPPPPGTQASRPMTVLAPPKAVLKAGEVGQVFVVRNGVARKQVVALGDCDDQKVEILSGLTGSETLVANPEEVRDGDAVHL
jgi:membrane fusion protein, multidrug efflux system